jgi:hypothetical protein
MRLLQLNPNANEATALDLHPMVTVVTDLSPSGRDRLLRAAVSLPRAGDPGSPGLIEAHGILLDLSATMLDLLDLGVDRPVTVTADDIAEVAAGIGAAAQGVLDAEAFLAATPAGRYADLDELRARQGQAREALALLREARDKARHALEDARVHRRRQELALESVGARGRPARLHLVTDADRGSAYAGDDADGSYTRGGDPGGHSFTSAVLDDPSAIDDRRRALEASVARIDRGLSELAGVDVRPIQVLLEAIHNPEPTEYAPSDRARQLADELAALQQQQAALEQDLEARGLGYRAAMARVDAARSGVLAAEQALRPPEFTEQDRVDLEAAHDEVLEAERKARGRGGRKRLEDAIEREQSILDHMGFPTWSAYVMGSTLMAIDPAAEQRLEQARFELDDAERHWSNVANMISADPAHRQVLDRLEALYVEAFDLIGEENHTDLENRLRTLQVPRREVSTDELVDALAYQLELIGMGLPRDSVRLDRVVLVAEAFLEEAAAIQDRMRELSDERVEALTELQALEERGAALASGARRDDDHPSVGFDAGEPPGDADLAELEAQLEAARSDEHDYAETVEARDSLVDAAIQVETVATGRLHKRAAELAAEASGTSAAPVEGGVDLSAIEGYLVERVEALRSVSYAGSVPLLIDDALVDLDVTGKEKVLDRLDREADDVQIVYVTSGDSAVMAWAERMGFERAAVVRAPGEFQ